LSQFYSSEQVEQSRAVLNDVLTAVPDAILIGGWGTWVRVGGAMSHDIDLIVNRPGISALKQLVSDMSVSRHIGGTKWRAAWGSVHLDLYVPYESRLGANIQLRVERLLKYCEPVGRYRVLSVPAHLATKFAALLDRPDSLPGRKDRAEILALLEQPGAAAMSRVVATASDRTTDEIRFLLKRAFELIAQDPSLDRNSRERLRRLGQTQVENLRKMAPELTQPNDGLGCPGPTIG
jgi:hypothetical protein